jgi:hypothetical protein
MKPAGARREDKWLIVACYEAMQPWGKDFGSSKQAGAMLCAVDFVPAGWGCNVAHRAVDRTTSW